MAFAKPIDSTTVNNSWWAAMVSSICARVIETSARTWQAPSCAVNVYVFGTLLVLTLCCAGIRSPVLLAIILTFSKFFVVVSGPEWVRDHPTYHHQADSEEGQQPTQTAIHEGAPAWK